MDIAVIGGGAVGTCSAYELALDGHKVTLFERGASIAEGASFANGGQLSPSLTQALSHPLWPSGAMTAFQRVFNSVRIKRTASMRELGWLLQWSKSRPPQDLSNLLRANQALLAASLERMHAIVSSTAITLDRSSGHMLLFSTERDFKAFGDKLMLLQDLGVAYKVLPPQDARLLEPGISPQAPLNAAIHFPNDAAANCRQFAQCIKDEALRAQVQFRLGTAVSGIRAGSKPVLSFSNALPDAEFDRVVVCAGDDPDDFLSLLRLQKRCAPVQSYSISLPIREPLNAPRSALFDMTNQVSITRNGARIRVSGGAELGNVKGVYTEKSIRALYASLQHYFPGAANYGPGGQTWRGNSLYSSDSLPLIGATPMDGVYLNMAHGNNGWGMACGAARLVADLIAQKATAVDASPFSPLRFRD